MASPPPSIKARYDRTNQDQDLPYAQMHPTGWFGAVDFETKTKRIRTPLKLEDASTLPILRLCFCPGSPLRGNKWKFAERHEAEIKRILAFLFLKPVVSKCAHMCV